MAQFELVLISFNTVVLVLGWQWNLNYYAMPLENWEIPAGNFFWYRESSNLGHSLSVATHRQQQKAAHGGD